MKEKIHNFPQNEKSLENNYSITIRFQKIQYGGNAARKRFPLSTKLSTISLFLFLKSLQLIQAEALDTFPLSSMSGN